MKIIISLLLLVATWTASASEIITKYDFGLRTEAGVRFVQSMLNDDGQLSIEVYSKNLLLSAARPAADQLLVVDISDQNFKMIRDIVRGLVKEEVVESFSSVVCMMMPADEDRSDHLYLNREFDQQNDVFTGALELVSGPQGCWVSHRVNFVNQWSNNRALRIKNTLRILVQEHAEELF